MIHKKDPAFSKPENAGSDFFTYYFTGEALRRVTSW